MGQMVGYMPDTWDGLLKEKDRVLYWSGEVLCQVADNIDQEDSFLTEYGKECIETKVDIWMESNQARVDRFFSNHPDLLETYKAETEWKLAHVRKAVRLRMRNSYKSSYKDIRKFTKEVDKLGDRQRKIHRKIQDLESMYDGDVEKFRTKFGPLRLKTFKNLRIGEKMMFQEQRLKKRFIKQVHQIDHKNMKKCMKYIDKWMEEIIEKNGTLSDSNNK